jgi:hypothetical protein
MTKNHLPPPTPVGGSFRDPSGTVYLSGNEVFRTISHSFAQNWQIIEASGFTTEAIKRGLLLPFSVSPSQLEGSWKTLQAERLPFISYPYEWCFGQLKDAALHTLTLMMLALEHGLSLKDASAYNIQFFNGGPIFIDHLSFTPRVATEPWVAYLQFCKHFLAPLALMCYRNPSCGKMLSLWIDGLPLELASSLLPWKTKISPMLQLHIHMHARMQQRHADARESAEKVKHIQVGKNTVPQLCESLRLTIEGLRLPKTKTEWGDYYNDTNYSDESAKDKSRFVKQVAGSHPGVLAVDLGANAGVYSRIFAEHFPTVIAADMDYLAVEKMYVELKQEGNRAITPLMLDLSNPSPALGWACEERDSFAERCKADLLSALALIHHLVLGAGIPLIKVARYFASLLKTQGILILEFVPKEDSQVQRMTAAREMVFTDYTLEGCITAFQQFFDVTAQHPVTESLRTLLVLRKRS